MIVEVLRSFKLAIIVSDKKFVFTLEFYCHKRQPDDEKLWKLYILLTRLNIMNFRKITYNGILY